MMEYWNIGKKDIEKILRTIIPLFQLVLNTYLQKGEDLL